MCGIAGFNGRFDGDLLSRMNRILAHRGPDDSGQQVLTGPGWRVGLAHRRLSIVDLSERGQQPMGTNCPACGSTHETPAAQRLWLSFNGEIYNFEELRRELVAKGHQFASHTDSEVLLHLYAEEGPAMLERLNGIFALAIYDGRHHGQQDGVQTGDLLLARDGIGVKPLYYAATADGFLFASELKALLACEGVDRTLDLGALQQYVTYLWACAPATPLRGVRKFEPGQAMIVRRGRAIRDWRFYELPYGREAFQESEAELAAQLRERLETAVRRQMMGDVPVGAFLSGGLDSSSIVAMMQKQQTAGRTVCYTIAFGDDGSVEGNPADLPYARRVADQLGVDLRVLDLRPNILDELPRMLYFLDEPQADPAPINAMLIAQQARRDGIKVLMSGAGGDDIFSGYRRHYALQTERIWSWLPRAIRQPFAGLARAMSVGRGPRGWMQTPLVRRCAKYLAYADLADDERLAAMFHWGIPQLRQNLFSRDVAAALQDQNVSAPLLASLHRMPSEPDRLQQMLYLETKHFLADHNLNYTDKVSMAYGVEVRVPLLDLELVDFATRIPAHLKQKSRIGKSIFKQAMEPLLPRDVIYRPKTGFGAPLRRWLHNDLQVLVEDVLSPDALTQRGLFDPAAVRRLLELDRSGYVDGAYTIFSIICIEIWLRQFLDRSPSQILADAA